MDKLHNDPLTLSGKGRVSLSPKMPESFCALVLAQLHACLPGAVLSSAQEEAFLHQMAALYVPGMSEKAFRLRTLAAVPAWAQNTLSVTLAQSEPRRRHIRETLSRCMPSCVITGDMVTRCEKNLGDDAGWNTCEIIRFAAGELLADPKGKHPLMQKLHRSARIILRDASDASRDDLRLVTLHALFDPARFSQPYAGYLSLRLGHQSGRILTAEAVSAATHLPLTYIREVEEGALQYLLSTINREVSHA